MQEINYNLTTREPEGDMYSAGIAYIIIPSDVDRDQYIQECFKTNTVSIYSEHNGYTNRVPIDKYSFNFISFPKIAQEYGSAVSFIIDPLTNFPIITGIYNKTNELSDLVENQFKFKRKLNNNVVEISGSPDGKYIGLNVIADKGGQINLKVISKDNSGKVNLNVQGSVVINADNEVTISQKNKFTCITELPDDPDQYSIHEQTATDESFKNINHNIDSTNVTTNADTVLTQAPHVKFNKVEDFKINDGDQPVILGKDWAQFMKDLIQEVGSSTVTTMLGQMPLLNAAQIQAYTEKVDKLLSKIAFIDK